MPATLPPADRALLAWARRSTESPGDASESDVRALRDHGYSDRAILDANHVIAYFNFVNRIVLGLGVDLEADFERYCGPDESRPQED